MVSEVMAAVPLPKVICTKHSYYKYVCDSKSSVSKDKMLVIQGIHTGKLGFGKIMLKVISMAK